MMQRVSWIESLPTVDYFLLLTLAVIVSFLAGAIFAELVG